jgi:transcriptional regulator with XRE-family HTH domain
LTESQKVRVGAVARSLREQQRLSQREVAEKGGLSQITVSRVERLESEPTESTVRGLSKGLGVSIAHLFGEESGAIPTQATDSSLLDRAQQPSSLVASENQLLISRATLRAMLREAVAEGARLVLKGQSHSTPEAPDT